MMRLHQLVHPVAASCPMTYSRPNSMAGGLSHTSSFEMLKGHHPSLMHMPVSIL